MAEVTRTRSQWRIVSVFILIAACLGGAAHAATVTISGKPTGTVTAGTAYAFTPTASDAAGRKLSFWITNKPAWASFSTATGALTGKPTAADVGNYGNISITAYDSANAAAAMWFGITVTAASGGTPTVTLSGTPATSVVAGSAYSFTPTAKDSAGKTLSFSVTNKPSWAAFSIATGQISGTPPSAQTDASITISASDGTASGALAPFTIKVSAAQSTGSATLAWTDPTLNTNGSTLTNLAGIHIYYGTSQAAMSNVVTVASTTQTSYTVTGLGAGTWYFGATAYTTSGAESAISQIGSKTIP